MQKKDVKKIAKDVIDLEIIALKKLKKSINNSFDKAVNIISKCQSKVIICGVGKSGLIGAKIAATLSSVGTPSFSLSANDCSHGDLGSISKKDILILISYSGSTEELKNIIKYANRNKITLIGIMSKKNSVLYKASDIKILIPEVIEAGLGIVPTSSTINQLSIGDALAVATLKKKKISKKIKIFIQVNIGDEKQKSGIEKKEVSLLISYCQKINLDVAGLMCLPPADKDSSLYFNEMNALNNSFGFHELSMGMSSDYIEASKNSATYVRIGSSIFGNRV